jgi:hypothetical protein
MNGDTSYTSGRRWRLPGWRRGDDHQYESLQKDEEDPSASYTSTKKRHAWKMTLAFGAFVSLILLLSTRSESVLSTSSPSSDCSNDFSLSGRKQAIRCHVKRARLRAESLQYKQSQTYEAAVAEYTRRNGHQPPIGFQRWFEWSKSRNSAIIDDFDQIHANLRPFRSLTPQQMRKGLNRVTGRKDPLDTIQIRSGRVSIPGEPTKGHIKAMHAVLDPIAPELPDMDFVLNWDDRDAVRGRHIDPEKENKNSKATDHLWGSNGWAFYTSPCPTSYLSESSYFDRPEVNFCSNINNTALVDARGDLQQDGGGISNLVPVMSWSKFSTSRDILVPHWAASTDSFRGWNRELDKIPFGEKSKDFYWRGTTTGSSMSAQQWRTNYRVRFVHYIQALKKVITDVQQSEIKGPNAAMPLSAVGMEDNKGNRKILSGLSPSTFDVGFTNAVQCGADRAGCDNLIQSTGLVASAFGTHEYEHQFLFDVDGNSMSGRFYRLLETNGLVFKQTILGEWHDDRLIPWYHYVPIGFTTQKDVPLLLDYFIHNSEGRSVAKQIAAQGRIAVENTFKVVDLSQFWYRLLIEYHSLFN